MKRSLLYCFLVFLLAATGCASKHMQPLAPSAVPVKPLEANETAIVFLRSTNFGGAIQAPIVKMVDGKLQYIAILSAGAKFRYVTTPGKHTFLVGGESGHILEAIVDGGKTYYVRVDPKMGFWKARFEFIPVPATEVMGDAFKKDMAWCQWSANKPDAHLWLTDNMASMLEKYATAQQKGKRIIMSANYGVTQPLP